MDSDAGFEDDNSIFFIDVKHKLDKFKFVGFALQYRGYRYDRDVSSYFPPPPLLTQKGLVAKRQPRAPKKSLTWWKAQCIFRGLGGEGTLLELQTRLKGHESDEVIKELQELEKASGLTFRAKNREAREVKWLNEMTDEEKARFNLKRFLKEKYITGEKCSDVYVMQTLQADYIKGIAKQLGLEYQSTDAPREIPDYAPPTYNPQCVAIGSDEAAVTKKILSISMEAHRVKQELKAERDEEERKAKALAIQKPKALDGALAACGDWDVTGTWRISCPYIEEKYGAKPNSFSMKIYREKTAKGTQMFAEFDFGMITGVMRFERQAGDKPQGPPVLASKKRKAEVLEDKQDNGYDDNDDDNSDRRSPTPDAFHLNNIDQPSAKHATWAYRYRCAKTGQGKIQLDSDAKAYEITFSGPQVRKLRGKIASAYFSECEFTGVKIDVGRAKARDIGKQWHDHS